MAAARRRLDVELVRRGLVESRQQAQERIAAGDVLVGGAPALKATRQVAASEAVRLLGPRSRYVGRGAHKLEAALDRFALDPAGWRALDAGASTGGFTDVLLQRGARLVVAVDVGHGVLHERLRADARVDVRERTNVRHLRPEEVGGPVDAVVGDLSFISLRLLAVPLLGLVVPGGPLVLLVKPQFEAGREEVARGRGIIRSPEVWRRTLGEVASAFAAAGATMMGAMPSPITGADGNVEFLVHLRAASGDGPDVGGLLDAAVDEVVPTEPAGALEAGVDAGPVPGAEGGA